MIKANRKMIMGGRKHGSSYDLQFNFSNSLHSTNGWLHRVMQHIVLPLSLDGQIVKMGTIFTKFQSPLMPADVTWCYTTVRDTYSKDDLEQCPIIWYEREEYLIMQEKS